MSGILFIISAPSGSGKSTLVNGLRTYVPNLEFSVSYTTRPPRGSEQDGHEYHFISREQFEGMIMREQFLEYALVFGNYYGTAKTVIEEAERQGHDVILDIDVQGAHQVKERLPEAISIFVLPPSREELESRLRKRSMSEHVPPRLFDGSVPKIVVNPKRTCPSSWVSNPSIAVCSVDHDVSVLVGQTHWLVVRQWNMLPDRSTTR